MRYLLALVCPPFALLACGAFFQAIFNAALSGLWLWHLTDPYGCALFLHPLPLWFWSIFSGFFGPIIVVVHALIVVGYTNKERRHQEILAVQKQAALMNKGALRQMATAIAQQASRPQVVVIQAPVPQPRVVPKVIQAKPLPPTPPATP